MSTNQSIIKPVIVFDFVYEIRTVAKSDEFDITHDHPELKGTILHDGTILYPSVENVQEVLKKELITGHKLKTFKIDQSMFQVLSQNNYKYMTYDFRSLPVMLPGDPKELIDGIKQYVIDRAVKYGGK